MSSAAAVKQSNAGGKSGGGGGSSGGKGEGKKGERQGERYDDTEEAKKQQIHIRELEVAMKEVQAKLVRPRVSQKKTFHPNTNKQRHKRKNDFTHKRNPLSYTHTHTYIHTYTSQSPPS